MNIAALLENIHGLGYVSITTYGANSAWNCALTSSAHGDEYTYYGSGATILAAARAASEAAMQAQVEREAFWQW